jgi:DNA (cytosine-5)-methyltransferase 1
MKYKFIDLFAGIGGFHLALTQNDMECVFASEIDDAARKTYLANHSISPELFNQDIRTITPEEIPEHDILCGGFPCQPFSQAGHKKGFNDGENSERGNLFYCILDILETKRPKAFILENVRHLLKHDEGRTFNIIYDHLIDAGYSVSFKVIKATDFGRPQHRPRIYIVGFNNDVVDTSKPFVFPKAIPLKLTMSDIWEGECDRDIGFTLRVGGKCSPIDDRRNWDGYRVNGKVERLKPKQGKRMMGLSDDFQFPVTEAQAMKQLGNSVCVDVVKYISEEVKSYLDRNLKLNIKENEMDLSLNKGEWSEFYAFCSLIVNQILPFGDHNGHAINDSVTILKLSHNNSDTIYEIVKNGRLQIVKTNGTVINELAISDVITDTRLAVLFETIKTASGSSFEMAPFAEIMTIFDIQKFKGTSSEKADLKIGFEYKDTAYHLDPIGIKSYAGSPPTLLNASSATNFIYEVIGFNGSIDEVNAIDGSSKIRDRIQAVLACGGGLEFASCEKPVHEANLRKVDSNMPEMLADVLLKFYKGEGSNLSALVTDEQKIIRFKDYLKAILLGMFSATPWDGNYSSNGTIVIHNAGDLVLYHVIKDSVLKDYLFNKTKLDTPSSTRHRFGKLYNEGGKVYMKLNLQIRNI